MYHQILSSAAAMAAVASLSTAAFAQDISAPTGAVILSISGEIATTNVGDTLQFDLATLSGLGDTIIETSTIWTDGVHVFQGVELATIAAVLGVTEGTFLAAAINDYTVEIPISDAVEGGAMIAYLMNGEAMSVRDKGPLWVVYPYDSSAEFRTEIVYSRSIWHLDRIEVVK